MNSRTNNRWKRISLFATPPISGIALATLFFSWGFSSQPYEEVHNFLSDDQPYDKNTKIAIDNMDSFINKLPEKNRAPIYLYLAKTELEGTKRLKYIRLSIASAPKEPGGYDHLKHFIREIPANFDISSYFNDLYQIENVNKRSIETLAFTRLSMLEEQDRRDQFLNALIEPLSKAAADMQPQSLTDVTTQLRRNTPD